MAPYSLERLDVVLRHHRCKRVADPCRLTAQREPRLVVGVDGADEPRDHPAALCDGHDLAFRMDAIDQRETLGLEFCGIYLHMTSIHDRSRHVWADTLQSADDILSTAPPASNPRPSRRL